MVNLYKIGYKNKTLSKQDFDDVVTYYSNYKLDLLNSPEYIRLMKTCHLYSYSLCIILNEIDSQPFVAPYLSQIKSSSIMLIDSLAQSNFLAYKLHQRILIENILRYIYYYHHEIEHIKVQIDPSKYGSMRYLLEYVKDHPFLLEYTNQQLIKNAIGILDSSYSSISKEIHKTTINEINLINCIHEISFPIDRCEKEIKFVNNLYENLIFLLCAFDNFVYRKLPIDEKYFVSILLSKEKRRLLNKVDKLD